MSSSHRPWYSWTTNHCDESSISCDTNLVSWCHRSPWTRDTPPCWTRSPRLLHCRSSGVLHQCTTSQYHCHQCSQSLHQKSLSRAGSKKLFDFILIIFVSPSLIWSWSQSTLVCQSSRSDVPTLQSLPEMMIWSSPSHPHCCNNPAPQRSVQCHHQHPGDHQSEINIVLIQPIRD